MVPFGSSDKYVKKQGAEENYKQIENANSDLERANRIKKTPDRVGKFEWDITMHHLFAE